MQVPTLNYAALSSARTTLQRPNIIRGALAGAIALVILATIAVSAVSDVSTIIRVLPSVLIFGMGLVLLAALYRIYAYRRKQDEALTAFAAANNITYQKAVEPNFSGLMFQVGDSRKISARLTIPTDAHPIEIGNYKYVSGSGKNRTEHELGYMHLKLPRKVPHMVLDAKANDFMGRFSNLPTVFDKDQKLQLEGDFNNYFTLYAPREYERDALYILTPDVMQALIDLAGNYDVELIDDDIFLYASRPFTLTSQDILQGLLLLASRLSPEFESQTDRYADERIANFNANIVAEPGRRLKKRTAWAVVVFVFIYIFMSAGQDLFAFRDGTGWQFLATVFAIGAWVGFIAVLIFRRRQ